MSEFEFLFSLFGLLLGLSLVEVVNGLVRTVKARRSTRLGWLTPLLGLFVMLDLTAFWVNAWDTRALIPVQLFALFIGMIFTAAYYFAASLVFPKRPETCKDLDVWYFEHKRQVLGIVLVLQLILLAILFPTNPAYLHPLSLTVQLLYFLLLGAAFLVRSPRLNVILLAALSILYLIVAVLPLVLRPIMRALAG